MRWLLPCVYFWRLYFLDKFFDFVEDIPFIGPIIGGVGDYFSGQRTNEANSAQAEANRHFQERMSSTSYQRSVADMSAAGLNPMLAYQQGGASSPGGSTATMQNPMASAIHSAASIAEMKARTANIEADTANKRAEHPGREAESRRLEAVAEDYPKWSREILKSERYLMAAKEDIARWNLSYEEKRLRIEESLLDRRLPAEVRESIARAVLHEVEAEYHPMKALGGVAANVLSGAGAVRNFFGGRGKIIGRGVGAVKGAAKGALDSRGRARSQYFVSPFK